MQVTPKKATAVTTPETLKAELTRMLARLAPTTSRGKLKQIGQQWSKSIADASTSAERRAVLNGMRDAR